ncbi:hypothetical protein QAD02_018031 [Eretmocerus hayati]|uniref:Uncharacterized protein n=1 Tax=Eretmocerus hayati TaxID=131215 RepID=A0ACC2PF93_9HYME|nr:hypothetical protein QAD02_018031 [Eretmocerus hayati]
MEGRNIFWVLLTCELVMIVASKIMQPDPYSKDLSNLRVNASDPLDIAGLQGDNSFMNWLQEILGYKPTIATTATTPTTSYQPEKCPLCYCGLANKQKIVGGQETEVNEYPWVALLLYRNRFYCGASVINNKYLLTAAHCVDGFQKQHITVRIMEHDRNVHNETVTQDFKVKEIYKHTSYSTTNYNNDIALMKIDGEFEFDHIMKPVCLAEKTKTFSGEMGIATGWGATKQGGPVSATLQAVTVPILSNTECRATKYPSRKITDNMLCAGYQEGMKDSCQGDSGGALHVQTDGLHRIVGVVSWGEGCAKPGYPGVYTRVNRYITWIMRNTEDACYCSEDKNLKF